MPSIRFRYPIPQNAADFERLCLQLLRRYWNCSALELFGRAGEKQHGIDILDFSGADQIKAAQCKLKEASRTLRPIEIRSEVEKARSFKPNLSHFALMTSARVSTQTQRVLMEINREHNRAGLFSVELIAWDQVQDLLDAFPEVAEEFYPPSARILVERVELAQQEVRDSMRELSRALTISSNDDSTDLIDREIDECKEALSRYEYQLARLLSQRLLKKVGNGVQVQRKSRLLSILAAAYIGEGQTDTALPLFLEAKRLNPDDENACKNEALSYLLLDEKVRAFDLASSYRRRFPNSTGIISVWLNAAPEAAPVDELEAAIEIPLRRDPEVAVALARRFLADQQFGKAKDYAKTATESPKPWSTAWIVLGQSLAASAALESKDKSSGSKELGEAEAAFTKAVQVAKAENVDIAEAEALVGRAQVYLLSGNDREYRADIESANRLCPKHPTVLRELAHLSSARGDLDTAVELMRAAGDRPDVRYGLAALLQRRAGPEDLEQASDILTELVNTFKGGPPEFFEHLLTGALDSLARLGSLGEADALIEKARQRLAFVDYETIKGRLEILKGRREEAFRYADKALELINSDPGLPASSKDYLAGLLAELGRHNEAVRLWQQVVSPGDPGIAPKKLLASAYKCSQFRLIVDFCRQCRKSGVYDPVILDYELSVLEKYDFPEAVAALQDYLSQNPDDKVVRLRLSILGLRLRREELISAELDDLPSAQTVDPSQGHAVVQVLRSTHQGERAVLYAYELLRRSFSDPDAHKAMMLALAPFPDEVELKRPDVVEPGTAVAILEDRETQIRWFVIEDTFPPEQRLNEIGIDHVIFRQMSGKRVGDRFSLAQGSVATRMATIQQILHKAVYRYQETLQEWQVRFPEIPAIESFKVQIQDDSQAEADLSLILDNVRKHSDRISEIQRIYREQLIPLNLVAKALGRSPAETIVAMALSDEGMVRCCFGGTEERNSAFEALATCGTVVLELSAVVTLAELGLTDLIGKIGKPVVVAQGTIQVLRELSADKNLFAAKGGSLSRMGDRFAFQEFTAEEQREMSARILGLVKQLEDHARITSGMVLAAVEPEQRQTIEDAFGVHGGEAVVTAAQPSFLLWTDDVVLGQFAAQQFGTSRVWTQLLLQWAALRGLLDPEKFFEATAKLVGWNYRFTSLSPQAVLQAGELAEWSVSRWPLKQVVDEFGSTEVEFSGNLQLFLHTLLLSHQSQPLIDASALTITAILDRIGSLSNGPTAIESISSSISKTFGVNLLGRDAAAALLGSWLRSYRAGGHPIIS